MLGLTPLDAGAIILAIVAGFYAISWRRRLVEDAKDTELRILLDCWQDPTCKGDSDDLSR